MKDSGDEDQEGFVDFTVATTWEALCAELEEKLCSWVKGKDELARTVNPHGDNGVVSILKTKLIQFRPESYSFALHFPPDCSFLSEWLFLDGSDPVAVLYPNSFSGCVLEKAEMTALTSALAVAASASQFPFALFVPQGDRRKRSFVGIKRTDDGHCSRLSTDCIRGTVKSANMYSIDAVHEIFLDSVSSVVASWNLPEASHCRFSVSQKLDVSWQASAQGSDSDSDMCLWIDDWNTGCPWFPWAEYEEPVASISLDIRWTDSDLDQVKSDLEKCASYRDWHDQNTFRIPLLHYLEHRSTVDLQIGLNWEMISEALSSRLLFQPSKESTSGYLFAQMCSAYQQNYEGLTGSRGVAELVSDSFWDGADHVPEVPSKRLLSNQVDSIFGDNFEEGKPEEEENLLTYLSLYTLYCGNNPRAIALLWRRFVLEVRLTFWEGRKPIPRVKVPTCGECCGTIDLDAPLLLQKMELINICIWRLQRTNDASLFEATASRMSESENPDLLTMDMVKEFDNMFLTGGNKRNRREVWKKMHGNVVRGICKAFMKNPGKSALEFDTFKAHFENSPYFKRFSKLSTTLRGDRFNYECLQGIWSSVADSAAEIDSGVDWYRVDHVSAHLYKKVEMALDWLENVTPHELFRSMHLTGVEAATSMLGRSRAVKQLEPVGRLWRETEKQVGVWVAKLAKATLKELGKDESIIGICRQLQVLEVTVSVAESLMQKLTFVSEEVIAMLLDDFATNVAGRVIAGSDLSCQVDKFYAKGSPEECGLHLLHLRRQEIGILHSKGPIPYYSTFICQDLDEGLTRFASTVTI